MVGTKPRPEPLGQVQSLVRALGLLDVLASEGQLGLAMYKLADCTGLPRSTAHRLLTTMEALGYVAFDRSTSLWSIGPQAARLAPACLAGRDAEHGESTRPFVRAA